MANTKSAAKRARQTKTRTLRNRSILTGLKTEQRRLRTAMAGTDKGVTQTAYRALISEIDSAAKRGVIHRNAANRSKSRITRRLAAASK